MRPGQQSQRAEPVWRKCIEIVQLTAEIEPGRQRGRSGERKGIAASAVFGERRGRQLPLIVRRRESQRVIPDPGNAGAMGNGNDRFDRMAGKFAQRIEQPCGNPIEIERGVRQGFGKGWRRRIESRNALQAMAILRPERELAQGLTDIDNDGEALFQCGSPEGAF